ncbi:acetyltransferase [Permianibacter sp. IMCC34836]|uniref:acetyltransferase n=1 Tax=Permianibacter fluminis TaxID=2738515 RepID=UPI001553E430|nr:acetyltransferase [Permianibacter fluminis]NQD37416.1 acetyltransferase [Permianibacter fluminis]
MLTDDSLVIVGAGGHGRVVADALLCTSPSFSLFFADDNPALLGQMLLGIPVVGPVRGISPHGKRYHVAIGDNSVRRRVLDGMPSGVQVTIIHPRSVVSMHAVIGGGTFLAAGSVIAAGACVGQFTIINHCAVVDHDCRIGRFCHIAPSVTLGGGVSVGDGVFVGAGAVVLPNLVIGENAVIGAGAVVTKSVPANITVAGVPAREFMRDGK